MLEEFFGKPKATLEQLNQLRELVALQQTIIVEHTKIMDRMVDIIAKLKNRIERIENNEIIRNSGPYSN